MKLKEIKPKGVYIYSVDLPCVFNDKGNTPDFSRNYLFMRVFQILEYSVEVHLLNTPNQFLFCVKAEDLSRVEDCN